MEAGDGQSEKPSRTSKSRKAATRTKGSAGSSASTPGSSATNPLGLEGEEWQPPDRPTPAEPIPVDDFEPPPAEPLEWTPERAEAIVRAGGFLLHTADGLSREPGGEELWRATEADLQAIAPPLARILNRYEPARRLAGVSDETELAIGLMGYTRRNLAERGRLITPRRQTEDAAAQGAGVWPEERPDLHSPE